MTLSRQLTKLFFSLSPNFLDLKNVFRTLCISVRLPSRAQSQPPHLTCDGESRALFRLVGRVVKHAVVSSSVLSSDIADPVRFLQLPHSLGVKLAPCVLLVQGDVDGQSAFFHGADQDHALALGDVSPNGKHFQRWFCHRLCRESARSNKLLGLYINTVSLSRASNAPMMTVEPDSPPVSILCRLFLAWQRKLFMSDFLEMAEELKMASSPGRLTSSCCLSPLGLYSV